MALPDFTMRQLLTPIEQTARLCGMNYLAPFVVHGSLGLDRAAIEEHAREYSMVVEGLRDGHLDLGRASQVQRLNADLDGVLGSTRHAR